MKGEDNEKVKILVDGEDGRVEPMTLGELVTREQVRGEARKGDGDTTEGRAG